ncbi:MAG: hypothetical protein K0R51_2234 [Cytophagaceae bacterium]|nr:hypothetical protein [Cytophagaceae bacterium]
MNTKVFPIGLILSLLGCHQVFSQTLTILSVEEKEAIPQTHVLYKSLSTNSEGVFLSDDKGKIKLDSNFQTILPLALEISSVGYQRHYDTLYILSNKTYTLKSEAVVLNEVVITAQYAANSPEKSVHKIKIIDRKKIDLQGAQNLRDILSNEMNVRISQDNVLGSSMSLQGISGQNVKILIDGVPVIGRLDGNIDISQINLNNVERIEIIEGPLSVNYGSDALAGTINVITKKSQKRTFSSSLNAYYETSGQYNLSGRIGYQKNKNTFSLSGGRNYFDGWQKNDPTFRVEKKSPADSSRFKDWKPKEQYFAALYLGRQMKEVQVGYTGDVFFEKITNRGTPRAPYSETAFDDYYRTARINHTLSANGKLSKNFNINVIGSYNYFRRTKNTYFKDLTNLNETLSTNSGDQDTTKFKTLMSRGSVSYTKDSAALHFEWGYDLNNETGYGARIKDTKQTIGDYAAFGSIEYSPAKSLVIRPGLRYAYNTAYDAPLIPSLNIRYILKEFTFRGSYAKGFRAPSVKDLYFYFVDINHNIVGNENLQAESSNNFSLSTVWQKKQQQRVYKVELSAFHNQIKNLITLALLSGTEYTYTNIGTYKTQGLNLNTELAIKHLKFVIGGSYIGRYNILSETSDIETYSYSPEVRSNMIYEFKKANLSVALFYKYNGASNAFAMDTDDNIYQTTIQAYSMADLSITKSFWQKRIGLTLGSKNLFDVKNITGSSSGSAHAAGSNSLSVGMGRTYFLKLDLLINSN